MSLTIDYVTMPQKSQEVSQIQHGEQVRYDQAQQEVASQFQQQVHQKSHQTVRRAKAENKDYRKDEKSGSGNKNFSGKKKKDGQKEEKQQTDPLAGGSFFDMKV